MDPGEAITAEVSGEEVTAGPAAAIRAIPVASVAATAAEAVLKGTSE